MRYYVPFFSLTFLISDAIDQSISKTGFFFCLELSMLDCLVLGFEMVSKFILPRKALVAQWAFKGLGKVLIMLALMTEHIALASVSLVAVRTLYSWFEASIFLRESFYQCSSI